MSINTDKTKAVHKHQSHSGGGDCGCGCHSHSSDSEKGCAHAQEPPEINSEEIVRFAGT